MVPTIIFFLYICLDLLVVRQWDTVLAGKDGADLFGTDYETHGVAG